MSSTILTNFVTIRKTRGDILKPAEFRSFVEMIRGVTDKYDFSKLIADYRMFLTHVANFNDPHHDDRYNFLPEIVQKTYTIYANMLRVPLSFADFQTQIVPSLDFLELIRRIVLNHYLYNQVKNPDGTVPASASATLSDDWGITGLNPGPVTLNFGSVLADEVAFIQLGWGANTTPIPVIFNAVTLHKNAVYLPIIFETSSVSPYLSWSDMGMGYPITLPIASNDMTISLWVIGTPTSNKTILTLMNSNDTLIVKMDATKKVSLTYNGSVVLQSTGSSLDGKINLVLTNQGYLSLTLNQSGVSTSQNTTIADQDGPFNAGIIGVGPESLNGNTVFGFRTLTFYQGYNTPLPS